MPKITVDGQSIECRDGIPVLQAVLEAGWDVPHYCYHPGLSIVASCRLCLMEMKLPHPQTKELGWAPKLFPSCQTPVKDGMEVRFNSEGVVGNQKHVMEYYLLNHPLDCPVCDKAGECYLQDYSEKFGHATSRMIEDKYKNPKKDIGSKTLLYQDRCVLCSRCVRFTDEVAGTGELRVVSRGSRAEIDVFPGVPLENELQGNVVDLCPVGALLSKEFLFKQRVWLLKSTPSITPADSSGASIWIDHNEFGIHRLRPRWNEKTNQYWISDEQRFGWKFIYDERRLNAPAVRRGGDWQPVEWDDLPGVVKHYIDSAAAADNGAAVAVVLSPLLASEEAWLLATAIRAWAPQATLVLGHVPTVGQDQTYNGGFTIPAEKVPNRRGIETIISHFGGPNLTFGDFVGSLDAGKFDAVYLTAGYADDWVTKELAAAAGKVASLIVHDLFPTKLLDSATVAIPAATWAEREGVWMNRDGLVQAFERAISPLEGVKPEGPFFQELAGLQEIGLYRARKIRERMAADLPQFNDVFEPRPEPEHSH